MGLLFYRVLDQSFHFISVKDCALKMISGRNFLTESDRGLEQPYKWDFLSAPSKYSSMDSEGSCGGCDVIYRDHYDL